MKHFYLLFFLFPSLIINAQSNCDEANSYILSAYSHVKDAYEANNISHLKYYANRSLESFKLSKKTLADCNCETATNLTNKSMDLLAKVEDVETYEDGRFFVKRARDISKECIIEIDKCSVNSNKKSTTISENTELLDLQSEQLKLKKQQEALKLKEEEIKTKLAQQNEETLMLKKKQLVLSYKSAISSNIKTYNDVLKICDCNHEQIKEVDNLEDINSESLASIRTYYTNNLKTLASNYLAQLNSCE
ncbi:hypothetical protein L3X39_14235 [Sabulilitoribacter multivorans]|uniref:DUF4398 domain-containing protein n=1 Tax=Flaviramulus multivorans TaxID=1304750 RepID=A0ABS9IMH8_9FLAO|nr:hypothetical protein [Flaviramulus multivorans]MCF7561801.1 hypothetical protein [Flaviramulus multivorans]